MDPNLIFWTAAVANFIVLAGFVFRGVRQIKRGEVARHRRSMIVAASLVVAFLVSYGFKLGLLGREDRSLWSASDVWILRFHELCVLAMIVGGGAALVLGSRLVQTRRFTFSPDDPMAEPRDLARHRFAGRVAVGGALLGVISAVFVWLGMLSRAGL